VLLHLRAAAFVDEVELKRIVGVVCVEALVALYAGFGLPTFNDGIAVTEGAKHTDEYYRDLLYERALV
jgi:hypothetical protein